MPVKIEQWGDMNIIIKMVVIRVQLQCAKTAAKVGANCAKNSTTASQYH